MDVKQVHDCIKQLQKAIECSICLDDLLNPVETRCGHSFCAKCLQTALGLKSVLPCPLCNKPVKKRSLKNTIPLSTIVHSVKEIKKAFNSKILQDSSSSDLQCSPILSQRSLAQSQNPIEPETLDLLDMGDDFQDRDPFSELIAVKKSSHSKVKSKKKNLIDQHAFDDIEENETSKTYVASNTKKCKPKKDTCKTKKYTSEVTENKEDRQNKVQRNQKVLKKDSTGKTNANYSKNTLDVIQRSSTSRDPESKTGRKKLRSTEYKTKLLRSKKKNHEPIVNPEDLAANSEKHLAVGGSDDCVMVKNSLLNPQELNRKVNEKVARWLKNVAPTDDGDHEESHQQDIVDVEDSDFDDLVSASQQLAQHQTFNAIRKRRKLVSDKILNDLKEESAKKEEEIFGVKTNAQQYGAKTKTKEAKFFGEETPKQHKTNKFLNNIKKTPKKSEVSNGDAPKQQESTTFLRNIRKTPRKSEVLGKSKQPHKNSSLKMTKRKKSKHMFDVIGLSQGVSPFSSPGKGEESVQYSSQDDVEVVDTSSQEQKRNMESMETSLSDEVLLDKADIFEEIQNKEFESLTSNSPRMSEPKCRSDLNSAEKLQKNTLEATSLAKLRIIKNNGKNVQKSSVSDSTIVSGKAETKERNFGSPVTPTFSQDSKSTIILDESKVTTVTATVHSQPKQKKIDQAPEFKTPITRQTVPTTAPSTSRSKYGLMRLEDMPIVCVSETQDDAEKQRYFVETPAQSEASVLPKVHQDKSNKADFLVNSTSKKSVELGLLDFSESSSQVPLGGEQKSTEDGAQAQPTVLSASAILHGSSGLLPQGCVLEDDLGCGNKNETATPSPRRSRRLRKVIEPDEPNTTSTELPNRPEKNKSAQSKPTTPKKKKTLISAAVSNSPFQQNDNPPLMVDNLPHSVPSNISSVETNIIENTESHEVTCLKSNLMLKKNANLSDRSPSKLKMVTNLELVKNPQAPIRDSDVIADSIEDNSIPNQESEIIAPTPTELNTQSPDDIFNPNSTPKRRLNLVHISATWPKAAQTQPRLSSLTSCGILYKADKEVVVRGKSKQQEESAVPSQDQPFEICSPLESNVSSSPSLFATCPSEKVVDDVVCAGVCDKCSKRQTDEKSIQVTETSLQGLLSSSKELRSSVSVQCSPRIGDPLEELLYLFENLKTICDGISKNTQVSNKIQELEDFLIRTMRRSECSSESGIKTNTKKRLRALSSSESEISCSPLKDLDQIMMQTEDSDIDDVEIENSLPELGHKRKYARKAKARTRKMAQKCTGSPETSKTNSKATSASLQSPLFSQKKNNRGSRSQTHSKKGSQELPPTGTSEETDIIQATSRTTCRRKRILSSDEESSQVTRPKKLSRSNKSSPTKKLDSIPFSNALFDTFCHSPEKMSCPAVVDLTTEPKPPISQKKKKNSQSKRSKNSYDPEEESSSVLAINESPPFTESQVPSPTPPPHLVSKENSKVVDLLQSISELTRVSRQRSDDAILQEQKNDDEQIDVSVISKSQKSSQPNPLETNLPISDKDGKLRDRTNDANKAMQSSNEFMLTGISSGPCATTEPRKFGVMVSGLRGKAIGLVKLFAKKWGGEFYDSFVAGKVTHAVVRTQNMRCDRTLKYLQAVASQAWVVSISWVTHSLKEKMLLPEDRFEVIGDNLELSESLSNGPKRSRLRATEFKLLSGFVVYCIPPFALFTEAQYVELLRMCGARVVKQAKELSCCRPEETRIITVDPDAYSDEPPNYAELAEKNAAQAVACSWALDCIATFNLQPPENFPVEDMDSEVL